MICIFCFTATTHFPTTSPGTQQPTTVAPGTQQPTTGAPGTQQPTTVAPGTQQPTTSPVDCVLNCSKAYEDSIVIDSSISLPCASRNDSGIHPWMYGIISQIIFGKRELSFNSIFKSAAQGIYSQTNSWYKTDNQNNNMYMYSITIRYLNRLYATFLLTLHRMAKTGAVCTLRPLLSRWIVPSRI